LPLCSGSLDINTEYDCVEKKQTSSTKRGRAELKLSEAELVPLGEALGEIFGAII